MAIDRRQFLTRAGASLALAGQARALPTKHLVVAGCFRDARGYWLSAIDSNGVRVDLAKLPGRGHGMAALPESRLVVFARRPGSFAVVVRVTDASVEQTFNAPATRHSYGHGIHDPGTGFLFATENDFETVRGVLGIYDPGRRFRRVGEWNTGGVGPHEIVAAGPGLAVVANGGIETHPDWPRRKLNLPDMESSLSLIDLATGEIMEQTKLPVALRSLSIRHIARGRDGFWFACQDERPARQPRPLLGLYRPGQGVGMIPISADRKMRSYLGSVAANQANDTVAVTAPRGGVTGVFSKNSGLQQRFEIVDVCGVASSGEGFLYTDGTGNSWRDGRWLASADGSWDNHLITLPAI